jgi:hypothetical protein
MCFAVQRGENFNSKGLIVRRVFSCVKVSRQLLLLLYSGIASDSAIRRWLANSREPTIGMKSRFGQTRTGIA